MRRAGPLEGAGRIPSGPGSKRTTHGERLWKRSAVVTKKDCHANAVAEQRKGAAPTPVLETQVGNVSNTVRKLEIEETNPKNSAVLFAMS